MSFLRMLSLFRKATFKTQRSKSKYFLPTKNSVASLTTVLAIRFDHGVIIGADGRVCSTAYGRALNYNTIKLMRVRNRIFLGFSGDMELFEKIEKEFCKDLDKRPLLLTVSEVAEKLEEFVHKVVVVEGSATESSIIVVGADENTDNYKMFSVISETKKKCIQVSRKEIHQRFVTVGSGKDHVNAFLKDKEKDYPVDLTAERGVMFVSNALKEAANKDWGTGGTLCVVYIHRDRFTQSYQKQDDPEYCRMEYKPVDLQFLMI